MPKISAKFHRSQPIWYISTCYYPRIWCISAMHSSTKLCMFSMNISCSRYAHILQNKIHCNWHYYTIRHVWCIQGSPVRRLKAACSFITKTFLSKTLYEQCNWRPVYHSFIASLVEPAFDLPQPEAVFSCRQLMPYGPYLESVNREVFGYVTAECHYLFL